jgi:hypothetical protein
VTGEPTSTPVTKTQSGLQRPSRLRLVKRSGSRLVLRWKARGAVAYRVSVRGGKTRVVRRARATVRVPAGCAKKIVVTVRALDADGHASAPRTVRVRCRKA